MLILLNNRTIQAIANNYLNDFITVLKREIQNSELSVMYPCAIIEIIRSLLKSQSDCFQTYLHILVEIILKSLETSNLTLRKHCHKYATHALHAIVKMFPNVSFNQLNQVMIFFIVFLIIFFFIIISNF